METRLGVAAAVIGILAGCDVIAPNHGRQESVYTSKDKFEVRITVEPKNVRSGQVFYITTIAKNAGTSPVVISAPYGGCSGGLPTRYLALDRYLVFSRIDGQPHRLSDGNTPSGCMEWFAPEQVGSEVRRTLTPGEELVNCRIECLALSPDGRRTPPGKYHVTWTPELKVVSPTTETLPIFAIDFEITD